MGTACFSAAPNPTGSLVSRQSEPLTEIKKEKEEFSDPGEVELALQSADASVQLFSSALSTVSATAQQSISAGSAFLQSLSEEECRIGMSALRNLRLQRAALRESFERIKQCAVTEGIPQYVKLRGSLAGIQKRLLYWEIQSPEIDISPFWDRLETSIQQLEDSAQLLLVVLLQAPEGPVLAEFAAWEEKLIQETALLQLALADGEDQEIVEEVVEEVVEERWEAVEPQEVEVACEAPDGVESSSSLPDILEDVAPGTSSVTTVSDLAPMMQKSISLCLPTNVHKLLCQVGLHTGDSQYDIPLEIPGIYSETEEIAKVAATSALRAVIQSEEVQETVDISDHFTSLMRAMDFEQDIDQFILSYYQSSPSTLSALLTTLQAGVTQSDTVAVAIGKVLNVAVDKPYPRCLALMAPRLLQHLPESALPSSQCPDGRLKLRDAAYLVEKLFPQAPAEGLALLRQIRPATMSECDLTLFLIGFKIKLLKCESLFQMIAGERDRAPLSAVSTGVREYLGLSCSQLEVETALSALDARKRGVVSRLAFTRNFSAKRFSQLCRLPEYSVSTLQLLQAVADVCIRRRREGIKKLSIIYRSAIGQSPLTRESLLGLLEAVSANTPSAITHYIEDKAEYAFTDFLALAEKSLIGPFASVYLSGDSTAVLSQ